MPCARPSAQTLLNTARHHPLRQRQGSYQGLGSQLLTGVEERAEEVEGDLDLCAREGLVLAVAGARDDGDEAAHAYGGGGGGRLGCDGI
eukprot:762529-Hanusia_phi.AAC.2